MAAGNKKLDISIYLAKEELQEPEKVLKSGAKSTAFPVSLGNGQQGMLYVKTSYSTPPPWASLFAGSVPTGKFGQNQSTGALLVVQEKGRLFLFSFGQGRHLVNSSCIETNFGLRAALNILEPNSIRSLDKASLETQPKQAREQYGEAVGLQFFGIDIESDLLRAITGKPKSEFFGKRISGGDSLRLRLQLDLSGIRPLAHRIYDEYTNESYKNGPFSWIDHIGEVKDKALREKLDEGLVESLRSKDLKHIWLCAPRIMDWDRVVGFKYSSGKNAITYHDTRMNEFLDQLGNRDVDVALLNRRKVLAIDDNDYPVLEDTVYRFIYAEIWTGGLAYILNAGKWYAVDAKYVQRIEQQYEVMLSQVYEKELLEYSDETEGAYNQRVANSQPDEFALLDGNNIYLPDAASPFGRPYRVWHRLRDY